MMRMRALLPLSTCYTIPALDSLRPGNIQVEGTDVLRRCHAARRNCAVARKDVRCILLEPLALGKLQTQGWRQLHPWSLLAHKI